MIIKGYIDVRVKNHAFVWIRPFFKCRGMQSDTYFIKINIDLLDDYGYDYEFTDARDLIINESLSDFLEICDKVKKIYIE